MSRLDAVLLTMVYDCVIMDNKWKNRGITMLNILSQYKISKDKEIVDVPWDRYFTRHKVANYFDESDVDIVRDVEGTSLVQNINLKSKFTDAVIGIDNLSDGCKTLLCINHAIKTNTLEQYVFNITSCGGNAVSYLATKMALNADVYVCIEHGDFGYFRGIEISVNGEIFKDSISASTSSTEQSWQ